MGKGGEINKLNMISKNRLWVLIVVYVLFIYVSLPFFPAFISTLRGFISKELLNLLSLVLSISFFLMLSVWIYKKKIQIKPVYSYHIPPSTIDVFVPESGCLG